MVDFGHSDTLSREAPRKTGHLASTSVADDWIRGRERSVCDAILHGTADASLYLDRVLPEISV